MRQYYVISCLFKNYKMKNKKNKGFGWILHKNYKGEFERVYMKSKKEAEQQDCKVYKTIEEETESMRYYGLQGG